MLLPFHRDLHPYIAYKQLFIVNRLRLLKAEAQGRLTSLQSCCASGRAFSTVDTALRQCDRPDSPLQSRVRAHEIEGTI